MQWYREPRLHFLLAGLGLFAVYGGFRVPPQREEPRRIEITTDDIRRLEIAWAARRQCPPTTLEMRGPYKGVFKHGLLLFLSSVWQRRRIAHLDHAEEGVWETADLLESQRDGR
jgi:hypothetical protein